MASLPDRICFMCPYLSPTSLTDRRLVLLRSLILLELTQTQAGEGIALPALMERLGLGDSLSREAGVMVILNERIVPPAEHARVRFRDEDHVVLQVMMAGG